ncbi:MAG: serine/threonine protein kinase [Deltaproteobacteria bacterium]|nr:serine/threonine protein kinase [Deltaproteobacteria bacterium]
MRPADWAPLPVSLRPPSEESVTVDLRGVLHGEEVARARVFFRVILVIALITGGFIPLLAGEGWLRLLSAALCGLVVVVAGGVLWLLRRPERYTPEVAAVVGVICGTTAVIIIYYIGPFSAGAMVLTLGVYFFGTSHSRLAARSTYGAIAALYLVSSAGIAAGVVPDRSLFSTVLAQPSTRWFQVLMSQVIFALTFYLARSSRRATEGALERVNRANLQIHKREALLQEARTELARALRPGEGRHSGQAIDGFTIGQLIGRGAMGEVYRGEDKSGLPVAIKLLHTNLVDDPSKVKRFLREAETAAAVDSPHVPRVYASGFADEGTPYLVMELLEGHDLGWHLRKTGRLDLGLVVEMCEHVAKALADVRAAGVVHRDLKPANIFLTDSLPQTWKVLDFGLSKVIWGDSSLTRDHAVGTPSYMAPEQVRGPKVDHLADLYALTAIAYRATTGTPPFSGQEVAKVLYRVAYQQPLCPGELTRIPVDLELVLALGMAKQPEDRFENVEQLAQAMRAAYEGELDRSTRDRGWAHVRQYPWGSSQKPRDRIGMDPTTAA